MRLWRKRFVSDGVSLTVLRSRLDPCRQTLLFVNAAGMGADLAAFLAPQVLRLGLNFLTWEMRGSPGPGKSAADFTLAAHVADATALLDHFDLGQVAVLGWCTGGGVALAFAAQRRGRVASLVLSDAAMLFDGKPGGRFGDPMYAMCGDIVADPAKAARYRDIVAPTGREAKMLGLAASPDVLPHVLAPYSGSAETLRDYAFAIRGTCAYNPREICRKVRCPTLLMAQSGDPMVSHRNSEIAAGLIETSILKIFSGGSHYALFTEPAPLRRAVDFMKCQAAAA